MNCLEIRIHEISWLHTKSRGINPEMIKLENSEGSIELTVRVSDETVPGVILSYKGRWLDSGPGSSNVNAVNSGDRTDMGESSAVHGVEVRLTPVG